MDPSITDLLAVMAAAGTALGGIVGFLLNSNTPRRMAENIAVAGAVGGILGTIFAFTVWVGLQLGSA